MYLIVEKNDARRGSSSAGLITSLTRDLLSLRDGGK